MNWWDKVPVWSKWVSALVGGLAAVWLAMGWAKDAYDHFEKAEHHNKDIQIVLDELADQKKLDRIQRNERELKRLERDLIAGRYINDDERQYMLDEIKSLKAIIHCERDGVCP